MAADRSVRYLTALGGASTGRVLNLMAIGLEHQNEPEYLASPMFLSPVFNSSILLKHRIRSDETYLFPSNRSVATKIIVPFDRKDLRLGGRSFFFEQRGFLDAMRELGNYREGQMERDLEVLRLINAIPSLDPFLMREHLRKHNIDVADCYFAISAADKLRMSEYVAENISGLIQLAMVAGGAQGKASTARLVTALLSTEVNEKLEPLRVTLDLAGTDFQEGVFSWRGFLYYKWCMGNFWPDIAKTLGEINRIRPFGITNHEDVAYISAAKLRIISLVRRTGAEISSTLKIYDDAYGELVKHGQPASFRKFLLGAPALFVTLGERMGAISHVVSFWRYRFPDPTQARADSEELAAILQDFESSFGIDASAQTAAA